MLRTQFINSITDISPQQWHQVFNSDYPFTRHPFLNALEQSGATDPQTGWQPKHLLIFDDERPQGEQLIAAMPGYIKHHSYGEYIFDWAWADAYHQYGYDFYPKIVFAIPFTPATGPRLAISPNHLGQQTQIIELITTTLAALTEQQNLSSWQILFPQKAISDSLKKQGWLQRNNIQFHWHNRIKDEKYQSFDDFLATFSSRKRKNLIKERQKVQQSGVTIRQVKGPDITDAMWQQFFTFYQATYIKRSRNMGYLNLDFFKQIGAIMPENIMMVVAKNNEAVDDGTVDEEMVNEEMVAAALYFYDDNTLYGRYWGCLEHFDMLHFECCYYQGIEFCIQHGLQTFDAGAQGEHKIARGFEPVQTYANYRIINPQFNRAIANYIEEEWQHNLAYLEAAKGKLPFKKG